jgi:glycosyltransferase involved in cell wall biosynthesis
MRFHMLGLAHTKTNEDYMACAYTQKVFKLCRMLKSLGHHVIHYGAEGSNPDCGEHVCVVDGELQEKTYGDRWRTSFFSFDKNDAAYAEFNRNTVMEVNRRKENDDFILASFGNFHKPITNAVGLYLTVEPGIGYEGVYSGFRVFESYAWMHHVYGLLGQRQGSWYDAVIPNYYDLKDFTFNPDKKDYFLFVGRLQGDKGVQIAIDVCRKIGCKLKIAGQGDVGGFNMEGVDVEYLGVLDKCRRN